VRVEMKLMRGVCFKGTLLFVCHSAPVCLRLPTDNDVSVKREKKIKSEVRDFIISKPKPCIMMWYKGHDGSVRIVESNFVLFMACSQYRHSTEFAGLVADPTSHFSCHSIYIFFNNAALNSWISVEFGIASLY
jgi:hypothetical protein